MNALKKMSIWFLLILLNACTMPLHHESTGEYIDSAAITTKVKASLVDALGAEGFAVKVKTYKDEVQLSGFVDSAPIRARAALIASGVEGVKNVRNDLIIKSR